MKTGKEERRPCANEGCGRPAEADSRLCETCCLEWTLFRRDTRGGRPQRPPLRHGG
jgi:hypothetical protein